jgi:hypothetical protein
MMVKAPGPNRRDHLAASVYISSPVGHEAW